MNIDGVTISISEYLLKNGKYGTLAVFIYPGPHDPNRVLDYAVKEFVSDQGYYELIDSSLSNPWMRVVVSNINNMHQEKFDPEIHNINNTSFIRDLKIDTIVNND